MTRAALKWVVMVACVVGAVSTAWAGIAPSPWKFNVTPAWASAPAGEIIPYTVVFEEMARGSSSCCNGAILPQEHRVGNARERSRSWGQRVTDAPLPLGFLCRQSKSQSLRTAPHPPVICCRWDTPHIAIGYLGGRFPPDGSRSHPVRAAGTLLPDRRSPAVDVHRYMHAGAE